MCVGFQFIFIPLFEMLLKMRNDADLKNGSCIWVFFSYSRGMVESEIRPSSALGKPKEKTAELNQTIAPTLWLSAPPTPDLCNEIHPPEQIFDPFARHKM